MDIAHKVIRQVGARPLGPALSCILSGRPCDSYRRGPEQVCEADGVRTLCPSAEQASPRWGVAAMARRLARSGVCLCREKVQNHDPKP